MSSVTLNDGTAVDTASNAWRDECLQRLRHVQAMRSLTLQGRRDYLDQVERAEGQRARQRLAAAFLTDWERRKAGES